MNLWGDPTLNIVLAVGYLGLISLMWLLLCLGVPLWGRRWSMAASHETPAEPAPRVTICVPARNEALNIGACVAAALKSEWPALELVVIDDRSEDRTGDLAREAAAGDPRCRVISGVEPPTGWAGKVWACARAAGEAQGELLLFIDADVVLHPRAVPTLVATLRAERLSLLSCYGRWTLVTFWERAVIPTVGWLIRGAVDLDRVNDPGRPEAFANGQLILVQRADYEGLGGHGAVRDQILDDVRLGEAFKRRGLRIGLRAAAWAFDVRLYRSLSEIVHGYTKNLYEGMGRQPLVGLGAVLFIFVGTLFPFAALAGCLVGRLLFGWGEPGWGWIAWIAATCGLQLAFRARVELRDGRSPLIAWTHPLANLLLVWILIRSVLGMEARWKGRRFVDGRAAP